MTIFVATDLSFPSEVLFITFPWNTKGDLYIEAQITGTQKYKKGSEERWRK
ncbi:MAG: hypothetical protein AAGU27_16560 [Dehalobacterium sp.]